MRNAALGKNERLLPQVITAFFREQSACNGRPATCGLRRSCFDLRVRRDATMRTAPRAALAAYRGHDARPQGDFLRLPSLLASRPTVVEPVPGRAVYHAAWSMPRTPPNDVCLHAPPSFTPAVCAAGHGRGGFHGALVQPRWKGRRAVDGRRMPLACSSPVAARGVGLAHEKRRSLPWLEARNQHTGGLSHGRHGGRAPGYWWPIY